MTEILSDLPAMWPAYIAYLVAVISPGPAIFAIIGTRFHRDAGRD